MRKTGKALVVQPQVQADKWVKATSNGKARVKTASSALSKYDPSKWLLSHVTIMASVDLEEAIPGDPKSAYLIKPEHSIFVNNNADCWERELLANTYKTFLGANNYIEHVQLPEHSKGKVVDVALREVDLGVDASGKKCSTLYVDLLIATSWEYPDICSKILSGEYSAVSMGCHIQYSQCSRCGNIAKDEADHCDHIKYYRKNTFYDDNGVERIVAEICGHKDDPESVVFIDASWVRKPAFPGAVLRNIVSPTDENMARIKHQVMKSDPLMDHVESNATLTSEHHDTNAFNKAASTKVAEGEDPEAARFGEEPEEAPADAPKEEEKTDDAFPAPEAEGGAGEGDGDAGFGAPEGEDNPEEPKTTPDEAEATPFGDIKKEIQEGVLVQIKQQLMDQINSALKGKSDKEEVADMNENESIFRTNDSLVREASSPQTSKYLKEKYSVDISEIKNIRLASAMMAVASVKDIKDIKKLGFVRKDALQVLKFVDNRRNGKDIGDDVIDFMSGESTGEPGTSVLDFILNSARKPSAHEKTVIKAWPKILGNL